MLGELTALPQLDLKDPTSNGRGEEEGQGSEGEGRVFSLYLSICGLKNVLENFSWGSWKVLDFLSVKEWEPTVINIYVCCCYRVGTRLEYHWQW